MTENMSAIVYTLDECPDCKASKRLLEEKGIAFEEQDMSDPDVRTDLNMDNIFPMSAPVINLNGEYLMSLSELTGALECH